MQSLYLDSKGFSENPVNQIMEFSVATPLVP